MLQANGITYEIETPDGPLKLLDNVSFNVPRGHFMAVVGPSGCGKTTLLKAIAGMIAETGGRFFWNGHDLAEEDFEPSEIGFVPQFSIAYDQLSVDENVESAARLRCRFNSVDDLDDSIDNALEVTGMEGITDRDVKILSGGQKRRLALAMELVSNPRLLICDEVTSGLDPRSEHDIVFLLHEISRSEGRIVISVTHSLSHLDRYDSILVMHQGCVAYHGSPKTMLHYFGVSSLEEIYPKLQDREGPVLEQAPGFLLFPSGTGKGKENSFRGTAGSGCRPSCGGGEGGGLRRIRNGTGKGRGESQGGGSVHH